MSDEDLIEAAVRLLMAERPDPRIMVRHLVTDWPEASALQVLHALCLAAGSVEQMLAGEATARAAQDAWRMTGLLATDLYMMELLDLPRDSAADLRAYWLVHDRFFLE